MKFRAAFAALAVLMAALLFAPALTSAQDISDWDWCGTRVPGWWKRKFGPKPFQIGDIVIDRVGPSTVKGFDVYSLTIELKNIGTQDYRSGMTYGLTGGSYYPNPEDDRDWGPWGPVVHTDKIANGLLLPAVRAGGSILIKARMNVPNNAGRVVKGVTMEIR